MEPVLPERSKSARNVHFCLRVLPKGQICQHVTFFFLPDLEKMSTGKTNTLFWSNEGPGGYLYIGIPGELKLDYCCEAAGIGCNRVPWAPEGKHLYMALCGFFMVLHSYT